MKAHRFAYLRFVGDIPTGMKVCHECDNPRCVNPSHLWIGTHDDNMKDMAKKKRYRHCDQKGEAHSQAKLTEDTVRTIRSEYAAGSISQKQLAQKHGITQAQICNVITRKHWPHVQ